ncbi:MAG: TerB family tellurite resistance protein [Sandaracinaceae bacterium]
MEDETQRRAEAAWARFDGEVSDPLLRAVSGAFAFVACADGHLAEDEVERFLRLVREQPALAAVATDALETRFRELADAFRVDFGTGESRAAAAVREVAGSQEGADLVIRAAQIAIVADERLAAAEEAALGRLCALLGVDPADV